MIRLFLITLSLFSFVLGNNKVLIETSLIKKANINPLEEFTGSIHFIKSSNIASQSSGVVTKINFQAGDRVKRGNVLVKIDSSNLKSKIKSKKALLKSKKIKYQKAQKDFKRYEKLIQKKSISQKTFDDSFFNLNSTLQEYNRIKADLEELLIKEAKKTIYAPFDGLIIKKSTESAQWLDKGKTIATLVDPEKIYSVFNLPSSYINKLDKTMKYKITLGEDDIEASLYAFIAKGDNLTRTFPVKFKSEIKNKFLYEGMEVKIELPRSKQISSLIVPRDAIIKRFGKQVVFIVDENSKAKMVPIKIIAYKKDFVAISAVELFEGADIIIKGNERISPNALVKILKRRD